MTQNIPIWLYVAVMALVTYAVRMLPLVIFRKKIASPFVKSFLYYMPYAVLGAMTIPGILYSTASIPSAAAGLVIAVAFAWKGRSLLAVAVAACAAAYAVSFIMTLI